MPRLAATTLVAVGLAACLAAQSPEPPAAQDLERAFEPGGQITMDLSAGGYAIEGSPDSRIRLRWSTRDPADAPGVRVRADVTGSRAEIETDGPSDGFHVTIAVPSRSDLLVRLSAGDLTLTGIEGHKDVSAWAGDVKIGIRDPKEYRSVDTSVTAGDIQATPFGGSKGGLFRSFSWEGQGQYDMRVRLTAGDLVLRLDQPR